MEMNLEEAAVYVKIAAENGRREAQFKFAVCLMEGKGVPVDKTAAARYFQKAAAAGHQEAGEWHERAKTADSAVPKRIRPMECGQLSCFITSQCMTRGGLSRWCPWASELPSGARVFLSVAGFGSDRLAD
jgi:TPR repeat protein